MATAVGALAPSRRATRSDAIRFGFVRLAAVLAVILVAVVLHVLAVQTLPIDYDEDDYLRAGQQYAQAIETGNWATFTTENYRTEHPPLEKIAYGVALTTVPSAPLVPDLPSDAQPAASLPARQLETARNTSALFGILEAGALALVSPLAGLLLAINTWQTKYTSQVMLEALPALTSALAVLLYWRFVVTGRRGMRWLAASAVALGLTAAGKYLYCVAGIAIALDWLIASRPGTGWRTLAAQRPALGWLRRQRALAGWGLLAVLVFLLADPYLWPDPIGRLWASVAFHAGYAESAHVKEAGYPLWQPFAWLLEAVPWSRQSFALPLDAFVSLAALLGLRRLWQRRRVFALWLAVAILFLLSWPTKWPQYILILLVPLTLAASEGLRAEVGEPLRRWWATRGRPRPRPVSDERSMAGRSAWASLPWLAPGVIAIALLAAFPLLFQLAMALTDFSSQSIRDGLNGGVWREVFAGLTLQTPAAPLDSIGTAGPGSQVHYVGSGLLGAVFFGDGGPTLFFDILWTVASVGLQTLLGVSVALLLHRRGVRFAGWWRTVFILPWAIPEFVGAVAWLTIADPHRGWLSLAVGQPLDWGQRPEIALLVMLVAATWWGFPLMLLAAGAGLRSVPRQLAEAAALDGATAWQRFRYVTWPLLAPMLAPALLIRSILAFNQFYLFWVMQPPLPPTLAAASFYTFDPLAGGGQFAVSAAINVATIVVLGMIVLRFDRWRVNRERAVEGTAYA